ncbi:dipeptide epimerase [Acuticoccus sp. M5D2P5]|uniref:N-acetyl-D-Glu racemase DgcA n=1 Tax=Acuticoccus kalidii TaxID=2910977 RepID=UPI001F3048DF|nr:N-acetyl-D-Glu racemase DgcA [Acuticoccus kalidii]MCF3932825.1 dipeptide epimerase [Acuticoccus kalidii]
MINLAVAAEEFPIASSFNISRERRTIARVVVVTLIDGDHQGRGEAVPYPRYGESVEGVIAEIEEMREAIGHGMNRFALREGMKAGAARNALDCALIDLEAKRTARHAADILGIVPQPLLTAYTISVDEPSVMSEKARNAAEYPLLKVKLGAPGDDAARIAAVRKARPDAALIVDANEGWNERNLLLNMRACANAGVELIEQPLPAGRDGVLATVSHPVPICADESVHVAADLDKLVKRYDAVNVKLDKAGGVTEALDLIKAAREKNFKVMMGCMLTTSLGIAPAIYTGQGADFVDLDGPLLLAHDRSPGLIFEESKVNPPLPELWG